MIAFVVIKMAEDPKLAYEDSLHGPLAELEKLKLEIVEMMPSHQMIFPPEDAASVAAKILSRCSIE